jgi:thiol-disulfide isomerase/thioredoxin
VILVLVGLVAFTGLVLLGVEEARRGSLVPDGVQPKGFTMKRFGGGTLALDELKGKVVMLDFWATWCPPCREEMPYLVKLAKEYEAQGLVFVAASRDDAETAPYDVAAFVRKHQPDLAPYVVYATDDIASAFQVSALPTLYFLDREGKVVDAQRGMLTEEALRRRIERALK